MIGITRQDDLGDGAGLVVTGMNYEHRLVLLRVELIAERGMDLGDAVSGEGVLQRSFAGGYASQQILHYLVLIRRVGRHALQCASQIVRGLKEILHQLCCREPNRLVALPFNSAAKVLSLGEHAQELLLELGRIAI